MRFSVLATHYNTPRYLPATVRSVVEQSYPDWELILMDDNSPCEIPDEVLELCEDERIKFIRMDTTEEERSASVRYASLINYGFTLSTGDLISYLGGDDLYMPNRFERMLAKIREGNDVVYGPQLLLNENGGELGLRKTCGRITDGWHLVDFNSVTHTREAFERVGAWPTNVEVWTDADGHFWRALGRYGYLMVPVDGPEPTDAKVYRNNSVTHNVLSGKKPWDDQGGAPVIEKPHWVVSND